VVASICAFSDLHVIDIRFPPAGDFDDRVEYRRTAYSDSYVNHWQLVRGPDAWIIHRHGPAEPRIPTLLACSANEATLPSAMTGLCCSEYLRLQEFSRTWRVKRWTGTRVYSRQEYRRTTCRKVTAPCWLTNIDESVGGIELAYKSGLSGESGGSWC